MGTSPKTCHGKSNDGARGQASVRRYIMLFSFLISAGLLFADRSADFTSDRMADIAEQPSDTLHAVTVTADKGVVISRTDTIHIQNSFDISGQLHQVPGLQLGDYGGYAGLKTVSLRGLGSPHTAIYVDGVRVGNVQSGQGDLGMLEVENYGSAVVDYAQNSISFNTARPEFTDGPVAGEIRLNAGSFCTYLPSARMDFKLSEKLALSANAAGVLSKGDFPLGDGGKRLNSDIRQVRGGVNLFGTMNDGDYHVKAFYNAAERGTPGSVSWPSEDRQKDENMYIQATVKKQFSELYTLRASAKAGYDDLYYSSSWGDSQYGQTELQLNSSHIFNVYRWWNISLAADLQWDKLASTNYAAQRITTLSALTSSFNFERLSVNVAAEYAGYFDKEQLTRHAISPSMDFRLRLTEGLDIVGFGRQAYRVPMFNELYYVGYGNPELLPEDAWLTDIGLDFYKHVSPKWNIKAKLDGFHNRLTNKITSAPTVGLVANALSQLSDEASNPVIIMNKATWGAFKAIQYANGFNVDPFEGLPVIFNNSLDAYSSASGNEVYMIVGDLGVGALANYPDGDGIEMKYDDTTLMTQDLVRILGRRYVGINAVADKAFVNIAKPASV